MNDIRRDAPLNLEGERFRALGHDMVDRIADFLDGLPSAPVTAGETENITMGIFGDLLLRFDSGAHLGHALVDGTFASLHLMNNIETLAHIFLLGDLEPHDILVSHRVSVQREAGGIGTAMLQRLEHRGQLAADIRALSLVNQSCDSAHGFLTSNSYGKQSR